MFSQLAQVCVPAIAGACTIDLVEEGGHRHRIRQPADNQWNSNEVDEHEPLARADFSSDGAGGPRFSGVLVCGWFDAHLPYVSTFIADWVADTITELPRSRWQCLLGPHPS